jgi:hypothetical protein
MKISLDTEADGFDSAIRAVHAAYGVPYTPSAAPVDDEDPEEIDWETESEDEDSDDYLPGKWNRKRIRKLVNWVTEDAAEALRYIAENAPAVSIDDVIAHMAKYMEEPKFNGQAMGGRMASVGFAQKRIKGTTGKVVDTDYRHRKYRMDSGIAKVLLEELAS